MDPLTEPLAATWLRVADPDWHDPIDPSYSARAGGRWNAENTVPTLYMCDTTETARGQVRRLFADRFVDVEDLTDTAVTLIAVNIPAGTGVDAHTDAGLTALGLPVTYPHTSTGKPVSHTTCQPIGARMYSAGFDGVCARSAAPGARPTNIELAWFPRGRTPTITTPPQPFGRWR